MGSVTVPYKEGYDPLKGLQTKSSIEDQVRATIDDALSVVTSASQLVEQAKILVSMFENGTDTCPTVTIDPPIDQISLATTKKITLVLDYGSGCTAADGATMAGSMTAVVSDLSIQATGISADIAMTADSITRNGESYLDGSLSGDIAATIAVVGGETTIGTLTVNLGFNNLSIQGNKINGQVSVVAEEFGSLDLEDIASNMPGKVTVTMTNLTAFGHTISSGTVVYTTPGSLTVTAQTDMGAVNLNLTFDYTENFDSVTLSTITTGTAGDFNIDIYDVCMDQSQCVDYPVSGDVRMTQGPYAYKATFTNACDGKYTLVAEGEGPEPPVTSSEITGWWWNKAEPGTGISVEEQGDNIYLAWYAYDSIGWPWWYTCLAGKAGANEYHGKLQEWYGWQLGTEYFLPESADVGTLVVKFNNGTATFDWTSNALSGSVEMTKFMDDSFPGAEDSRELTGWWWEEKYAGMGLYFEAQANTFYGAWFFYDDLHLPYWWSFGGTKNDFPDGTKVFESELTGWRGGAMALGGVYALPSGNSEGSIKITFNNSTSATVEWSGQTYNLTRFNFKNLVP